MKNPTASRAPGRLFRALFAALRPVLPLLAALLPFTVRAVGTWTPLTNLSPGPDIEDMLLMVDGTVLAHDVTGYGSTPPTATNWYRLTPDANGSYVNGTWTKLAAMNYSREAFATQVLPNGQVFACGDEYGTGTNNGEIYDPIANTWTVLPVAPGLIKFSDSISEIMPNGNVMVCPADPVSGHPTVIWNVTSNAWQTGPSMLGSQEESSWMMLADGSILTTDYNYTGADGTNTERYVPAINTWVKDGTLPVTLLSSEGELGGGFLLPNGKVFLLGGTGNTVTYTPWTTNAAGIYTPAGATNAGVWTASAVIPDGHGIQDGPAAMMVNGNILCCVATNGNSYSGPSYFYEYNYLSNSFTAAPSPTGTTNGAGFASRAPWQCAMLDLPDGTVLFSAMGSQLYVYTPDGSPLASGRPAISSVTTNANGSYHVTGTLFNGISEGAAYGDDEQMRSDYPIARLTNSAGAVFFGRTTNWSGTVPMTGTNLVSTDMTLPAYLPAGTYPLVISANGISSAPFLLTVTGPPLTWDASSSSSGPQDGSGAWGGTASNWWNGVSDVGWSDTSMVSFGVNTTTNCTVTLANNVTPASLAFNATGGGNYTIAGASNLAVTANLNITAAANAAITCPLAGTNNFTVNGPATLTLSNSSPSYNGMVTVNSGALVMSAGPAATAIGFVIGANGALYHGYSTVPAYTKGIVIYGNGTGSTNGLHIARGVTLAENQFIISNAPTLITSYGSGANAQLESFDINYNNFVVTAAASGTIIDPTVNINLAGGYGMLINTTGGANTATGDLVVNGLVTGGGNALRKNGSGSLRLSGTNTYTAGTIVSGGSVQLNNATTPLGTGPVSYTASGTLQAIVATTLANGFSLGAGDTLTVDTLANTLTISGAITNAGALTKISSGTLVLSGADTYTGATAVNAGTLQVDGSVASAVSVASGATLSGTGTLSATPTLAGGSTLSPGDAGLGTLSFGGSLTLVSGGTTVMNVANNSGALANDQVAVTGTLAEGGTLTVSNSGSSALAAGNSFTLFTAGTFSGSFSSINLPTLAAGLAWNTNNLTVNGTISVYSTTLTLTYSAGPNGSISGASPQTVPYGGNGTAVTALPASGYAFTNWSDASTADPRTDTGVTGNITVTANFVASTNGPLVWNGGGGVGNWSAAGNWDWAVPANGQALTFQGTQQLNNTNDFLTAVGQVGFNAGGFNLAGNPVTLQGGLVNGTGNNTWSLNATLGNAQSFVSSNGTLTVSGAVTNAGYALTLDGPASNIVSGVISGSGALVKNGAGTAVLSGASTFTNTVSVNAGVLQMLNKSGDVAYTIAQGATLQIGYNTLIDNYANTAMTINGNGAGATTGFYLAGGKNYNCAGKITLQTAPTTLRQYGSGYADLGIFDINAVGIWCTASASGSVLDPNIQLVNDGYGMSIQTDPGANTTNGDLTVNGPLAVTSLGLYKYGTGSLLLNGVANNTNTAVQIKGGTLICGATNCLGVNAFVPVSGGATLLLNGFSQTIGSLNSAAGSTVNFNGTGTLTVGTPPVLAGALDMAINSGTGAASLLAVGAGTLTNGGTLTVTTAGANTLAAGQSFQLFSAGGYAGGFSSVTLPTLATWLVWNTNNLYVNGTISVVNTNYATQVLAQGPNSYWRLGETNGSTSLLDASGNGHTATAQGTGLVLGVAGPQSPAYPQFESSNTAAQFNGASNYLSAGTAASLAGTNDFTVSAWIQTTANTAGVVIQQRDPSGPGYVGEYQLAVNAGGTLNFFLYGSGGYQFNFATKQAVNDGQWHTVMAERSGGTNCYLYIDGALAAATNGAMQALSNNIITYIGRDVRNANNNFNGQIDEVAIFTRALTGSQIAQLANTNTYALPSLWSSNTVGAVAAETGATYFSKAFSVAGAGTGLTASADSFSLVSLPVTNSLTITAEVGSLQTNGAAPLAGVMIRSSTNAGAEFAFLGLTPTNSAEWIYRGTSNTLSSSSTVTNPALPYWVRLVRSTNTFTGLVSSNGTTWVQVASVSLPNLTASALAGLAVSSGVSNVTDAAVFDGVTVTNGGVLLYQPLLVRQPVPPAYAELDTFTVGYGAAHFTISGDDGSVWQIEESNDLVNWTPVETVTLIGGSVSQVQSGTAGSARYYRLVQVQ